MCSIKEINCLIHLLTYLYIRYLESNHNSKKIIARIYSGTEGLTEFFSRLYLLFLAR